jgi:hypothetical protein
MATITLKLGDEGRVDGCALF